MKADGEVVGARILHPMQSESVAHVSDTVNAICCASLDRQYSGLKFATIKC